MTRICAILAAGKGTRLSAPVSKMLIPLGGRPLVTHPVSAALRVGCDAVTVVVGHQGAAVRHALEDAFPGVPLQFAIQREQRGTGHAVAAALAGIRTRDGELFVLSGDVPLIQPRTLRRLGRARARAGAALALLTMELEDPTGYGRVVRQGDRVQRVVEHADATRAERAICEVNAGLYCMDIAFVRRSLRRLRSDNAQGEFYLTDLVAAAVAGTGVVAVRCDPDEVRGVNTWAELAALQALVQRRILARWMRRGVFVQAPERTWVDEAVRMGAGTVLAPGVVLRGKTRLGQEVSVDVGAVLDDCRVGRGARIGPYAVLSGVRVAPRTRVPPHTVLNGDAAETLPPGVRPIPTAPGHSR